MSSTSDFEIKDGVLERYNGSDKNVVIPYSVTAISKEAFKESPNLKSKVIPSRGE